MSDVAAPLPRIPRWFIVSLVLLTALLIVLGIIRSNRSSLRGDEVVTLFWNRQNPSTSEMLRGGARGQVSPAPLYYLVGRAVDDTKERVGYLGLRPSGYFRLPSLLFTAGLGAAAAWLIALRLRRQQAPVSPIAYFLVLCGIAVYWFQPKVFSFACVDRPYGLWNGLWLLSLALLFAAPDSKLGLGILLSLMATTATAACFQILAIAIGYYGVLRAAGKPPRDVLREGALLFTGPALIAAYYALRAESSAGDPRTFENDPALNLLKFWLVTNLHAWIVAGLSCLLILRRPKLREYATPVVAFAIMLLIVPLIYSLARLKGYSSPSRQYIWTTTALPLTLFLAALSWPELKAWKPAPKIAVFAGAALVIGFSVATYFRAPARNDSRRLACLDRGSPLELHLRQERPAALSCPIDLGEIEYRNLRLLAEWIGIRYHSLPQGARIAPIRDVDGELISDPMLPSSEELPPGSATLNIYY